MLIHLPSHVHALGIFWVTANTRPAVTIGTTLVDSPSLWCPTYLFRNTALLL